MGHVSHHGRKKGKEGGREGKKNRQEKTGDISKVGSMAVESWLRGQQVRKTLAQ